MKTITTPDNEVEVWEGPYKIAYVENGCLYLVGGQFVGIPDDNDHAIQLIKKHRKKAVQFPQPKRVNQTIKWN